MEFRKVFDTIPDEFDKGRTSYCDEAFRDIIKYSELSQDKDVLEIGPGTGQATEPILKTKCNYTAIELGEHLAEFTKNKFKDYTNFNIVNGDFQTYDFGDKKFDLVFSAATIQWIPEEIAFTKSYKLLKDKGTFAMMLTHSDEKKADEFLNNKIQGVYSKYFKSKYQYNCHFYYNNVINYGYKDFEIHKYNKIRELNADEYISWISTHATHITLEEPNKSQFYSNIRKVINEFGGKITIHDTIILYLVKKS